jgi:hypothetical protein
MKEQVSFSYHHKCKSFSRSSSELQIRFLKEEGKEHKHVFWMMGQVIGLFG